MLNFQNPVTADQLEHMLPEDLIDSVLSHCASGKPMHPDALMGLVIKLTYLSRDMRIGQNNRDRAAELATNLANAAIKSYGSTSEFGRGLINTVRQIVGQAA